MRPIRQRVIISPRCYALLIFFMVVTTNVDYEAGTENITSALKILKSWKTNWSPLCNMMDCCSEEIKGATKSYRKIIFVSASKIGENVTNRLNTYMSEIKCASHKQYLIGLLVSIKVKEDSYRPKYTSSFLICPNLNDSQTFKSSRCNNVLPQCVCYRCNLVR